MIDKKQSGPRYDLTMWFTAAHPMKIPSASWGNGQQVLACLLLEWPDSHMPPGASGPGIKAVKAWQCSGHWGGGRGRDGDSGIRMVTGALSCVSSAIPILLLSECEDHSLLFSESGALFFCLGIKGHLSWTCVVGHKMGCEVLILHHEGLGAPQPCQPFTP